MDWLFLLAAGLLEIVWAVLLKLTHGFSRFWPSLLTLSAMGAGFWLLSIAVKTIPLGTDYAVWTGIGAVGTVLAGIFIFGEPATAGRLVCVTLILAGILGLKFFSQA